MNSPWPMRLLAWGIAITLVVLPVVGVLNGWFAADRWPVTRVYLRAPFNHVSAEQIRGAVVPLLADGFFAVRLDQVRDAVEHLPWVASVEARKRWPDGIALVVHEQQPYAHWGENRLINRRGEVFDAPGAATLQGLPQLNGPNDEVADVLAFYADCLKEFGGSGLVISAVGLSARGGWTITLESGAVIEAGSRHPQAYLKRFLDVWPKLVEGHPGTPAYVDLRYTNGFALRWADAPAPATAPAGAVPAGAARSGMKLPGGPANGRRDGTAEPGAGRT